MQNNQTPISAVGSPPSKYIGQAVGFSRYKKKVDEPAEHTALATNLPEKENIPSVAGSVAAKKADIPAEPACLSNSITEKEYIPSYAGSITVEELDASPAPACQSPNLSEKENKPSLAGSDAIDSSKAASIIDLCDEDSDSSTEDAMERYLVLLQKAPLNEQVYELCYTDTFPIAEEQMHSALVSRGILASSTAVHREVSIRSWFAQRVHGEEGSIQAYLLDGLKQKFQQKESSPIAVPSSISTRLNKRQSSVQMGPKRRRARLEERNFLLQLSEHVEDFLNETEGIEPDVRTEVESTLNNLTQEVERSFEMRTASNPPQGPLSFHLHPKVCPRDDCGSCELNQTSERSLFLEVDPPSSSYGVQLSDSDHKQQSCLILNQIIECIHTQFTAPIPLSLSMLMSKTSHNSFTPIVKWILSFVFVEDSAVHVRKAKSTPCHLVKSLSEDTALYIVSKKSEITSQNPAKNSFEELDMILMKDISKTMPQDLALVERSSQHSDMSVAKHTSKSTLQDAENTLSSFSDTMIVKERSEDNLLPFAASKATTVLVDLFKALTGDDSLETINATCFIYVLKLIGMHIPKLDFLATRQGERQMLLLIMGTLQWDGDQKLPVLGIHNSVGLLEQSCKAFAPNNFQPGAVAESSTFKWGVRRKCEGWEVCHIYKKKYYSFGIYKALKRASAIAIKTGTDLGLQASSSAPNEGYSLPECPPGCTEHKCRFPLSILDKLNLKESRPLNQTDISEQSVDDWALKPQQNEAKGKISKTPRIGHPESCKPEECLERTSRRRRGRPRHKDDGSGNQLQTKEMEDQISAQSDASTDQSLPGTRSKSSMNWGLSQDHDTVMYFSDHKSKDKKSKHWHEWLNCHCCKCRKPNTVVCKTGSRFLPRYGRMDTCPFAYCPSCIKLQGDRHERLAADTTWKCYGCAGTCRCASCRRSTASFKSNQGPMSNLSAKTTFSGAKIPPVEVTLNKPPKPILPRGISWLSTMPAENKSSSQLPKPDKQKNSALTISLKRKRDNFSQNDQLKHGTPPLQKSKKDESPQISVSADHVSKRSAAPTTKPDESTEKSGTAKTLPLATVKLNCECVELKNTNRILTEQNALLMVLLQKEKASLRKLASKAESLERELYQEQELSRRLICQIKTGEEQQIEL